MILPVAAALLAAQGSGCAETTYPPELPPPSAIVDSAHAIDDLGMFADPKRPMVFSVVFNSGDSVGRVRALDKNDAAAAVSLANYVRHQRPQELWAIRVRIAGGDAPALTVERSEYCPPVSHSGDQAYQPQRGSITGAVATVSGSGGMSNPTPLPPGPETRGATPGGRISVEALIAIDGHIVGARVVASSGDKVSDASAVDEMKKRKFDPAKLDGAPIQAIYRPDGKSPRP